MGAGQSEDIQPMNRFAPELLEILVCPETHQPVSELPDERVQALNALQGKGELVNRSGNKVEKPLDGALIREDGMMIYPVHDAIPVMLIEEGIEQD
jgi:uncharacterized protein YbaR (Trm112 family)